MPHHIINRNRLIRSGLTLTTLTYVSHPRDYGNCYVSALPNAIRVRPIDMLYASRIRIRQIFRVCESTRRALPVGDRRETFGVKTCRGWRQSPSKRVSHCGGWKRNISRFYSPVRIPTILKIRVDLAKSPKIFYRRRIFKLK